MRRNRCVVLDPLRVGIGTANEKILLRIVGAGGPFHGRMVKDEEDVRAEGSIFLCLNRQAEKRAGGGARKKKEKKERGGEAESAFYTSENE